MARLPRAGIRLRRRSRRHRDGHTTCTCRRDLHPTAEPTTAEPTGTASGGTAFEGSVSGSLAAATPTPPTIPTGAIALPRCIIRIPNTIWHPLCEQLLAIPVERLAYLLAHAGTWADPWGTRTTDLLVRAAVPVPDDALTVQTPTRVEVEPAFTRAVLRECYERGLSLVDVHTHPFVWSSVAFSGHDTANMRLTHAEFAAVVPQQPPTVAASIVLGHASVAGAWRNPATGCLTPIDDLVLLGNAYNRLELSR